MIKPSLLKIYNASAGSGKTYTLVKEYLTLVLCDNNAFRFTKILAITFTNKAADEMKERILKNLYEFSLSDSLNRKNDLFYDLCKELHLSPKQLVMRANRTLSCILHQYSNFSVSTIDKFTHRLIRTFSHDLGLSSNFEVKMNTERLLRESVEVLLSKLGDNPKVSASLIDYALSKIEEEKSWNIEQDLTSTAKILLKEDHQNYLKKIKTHTIDDFIKLRKKLIAGQKQAEKKLHSFAQKFNKILNENNLSEKVFSYGALPNYFKKFKGKDFAGIAIGKRLEDQLNNRKFYPKSTPTADQLKMDSLFDSLDNLIEESSRFLEETRGDYILNSLILRQISSWSVMNEIEKELVRLKEENNILFNAEFNKIISEEIKNQPAPYIYERIGERYHYYFIDEFQDTSVLQWNNLRPLIENQLAQDGSALIVGDSKQSIYRWRGGEPEQFIDLSESGSQLPFETQNLETNYRSFYQIISFNNLFYNNAAQSFENHSYKKLYEKTSIQKTNEQENGFVELYLVEKKRGVNYDEIQLDYVLNTIQDLEKEGFRYEEITVLVRKNSQGILIAQHLAEHRIPVISKESLLLKNAPEIQLLECILQILNAENDYKIRVKFLLYLHQDKRFKPPGDLHVFIQKHIKLPLDLFFKSLEKGSIFFDLKTAHTYSLYNLIEYCSRQLGLIKEKNNGYLQYFLDFALAYTIKNTNDLNEFLRYWEEKKLKESIVTPSGTNAVQVMTIHKSKGLQFPVVILPYVNWDAFSDNNAYTWMPLDKNKYENFEHFYLPVNPHIIKKHTRREEIIQRNKDQIQLDNLNILYVATTRAIERLYISTLHQKKALKSTAAFYFNDYLDKKGIEKSAQFLYQEGNKKRKIYEEKTKMILPIRYHSGAWQKRIKISKTAARFWDTKKTSAIEYGNKIHYILSQIRYTSEVEKTLQHLLMSGYIDEKEFKAVKNKIDQIVHSEFLNPYYTKAYTVFNERELFFERQVLRPDRIVIKNKEATIIDYKTGIIEENHSLQLNLYSAALLAMGYEIKEKILIYIHQNIKIIRPILN